MSRSKVLSEAARQDEIEITPEMMAAGAVELARYRANFSNEEDVLVAIFKKMTEASRHPSVLDDLEYHC